MAVDATLRLRQIAWAPDGKPGWIHRIRRDGTIIDNRRDLYDHAFVLHGLAWMREATGDGVYGDWIEETLAFIDEALRAPAGGWAESDRHELPRRQNPHMHFFEASIALYETSGDAAHLARAGELFGLFRTTFFDEKLGLLREYFGREWQLGSEYGSDRIEPGHMMEWVWLIRRFARSSRRRVDDYAPRLFVRSLEIGLDPKTGFLPDETDPDGKPLVDGRRLWVQTEYLKALLVEYEASRDVTLLADADALCTRLFETYLTGTVAGGFRDRFTLGGELFVDHIPASILYHLFAPLIEIHRLDR